MKKQYKFQFYPELWHMDLILYADDLEEAKKKFSKYHKKEFNGKIIQL